MEWFDPESNGALTYSQFHECVLLPPPTSGNVPLVRAGLRHNMTLEWILRARASTLFRRVCFLFLLSDLGDSLYLTESSPLQGSQFTIESAHLLFNLRLIMDETENWTATNVDHMNVSIQHFLVIVLRFRSSLSPQFSFICGNTFVKKDECFRVWVYSYEKKTPRLCGYVQYLLVCPL